MFIKDVFSIPETHLFTKGLNCNRLPDFICDCYYCYKWIKNFAKNNIYYSRSRAKLVTSFFNFIVENASMEKKQLSWKKHRGILTKLK
jgi:hypothetical protein